jgi:energy-coupling factor transporter ATP-binding protein EcfA2
MKMSIRKNAYPGRCMVCDGEVKEAEGQIVQNDVGRWRVKHLDGQCNAPAATVATKPAAPDEVALDGAVDRVIDLMAKRFTELVPDLVQQNLSLLSRVEAIKIGDLPAVKVDGKAHRVLPTIVTAICAGVHPFLVGPAGSGKTTLAEQVAKVLDVPFGFASRVTSEFKLLGFVDATGKCVRTSFRECFEHGGVFLFDEVDASDADAVTSFNAALANGYCDFPDGMVYKHKDFYAIAAGNTYGRGADRQYVGRNQLDAATLDRFAIFEVDYDEALEIDLCGNLNWARRVQAIRKAILEQQVRHIVSPRASISGARLLAAGMDADAVEEAVIWKGMAQAERQRVMAHIHGGPYVAE